MSEPTHVEFKYQHKGQYKDLDSTEDFQFVDSLKHVHLSKKAPKMLLVLDYMPKEDLRSGRLLSGVTNVLLKNILLVATDYYKAERKLSDFSWLAISYSSFKTAGKSEEFRNGAEIEFELRLKHVIAHYKPDVVVTFGPKPFRALNLVRIQEVENKQHHFYGVPIPTKLASDSKEHKFLHVPTLSLNTLVNPDKSGTQMYLAGYVARNLVNALNMRNTYAIGKIEYVPHLVDTIDKFKEMLNLLRKAKVVSIDTETTNLNRRKNKLLTIQFCDKENRAFFLPIYHKDSPFTAQELKYIGNRLRAYFEEDNENDYQVYANAVFDLTVLRDAFKIRFFKADVWDIFGGEYACDENLKVLNTVVGSYYYSLANISMQYGTDIYYKIEFGKSKRTTIETTDISDKLIEYGCLDVVLPMMIHKKQIQRAKDIGYDKFKSIVRNQISDMLHTFSTLEYNGVRTDIDYLFSLKTPGSPVLAKLDEIHKELASTKGVQKANQILIGKSGMPKQGLFGKTTANKFDIAKKDHQELLFFNVMKLKPVSVGKSKKPKVDKEFQSKYADKQEIKCFTALTRTKKLFNAYVKSFIKQWGQDDDMRSDSRIRPHFSFLDVVTGRTSAKKPSLHQIPARSDPLTGDLGKHIKRLFITEPRRLIIKVDFAAHEVRGWSLISRDKLVADVFDVGLQLKKRFKLLPTAELAKRLEYEGDVHKINAAYFFGIPIENIDKPTRNAVKSVIFGLIYQQGLNGLAKGTKRTLEEITKLVAQFKERFPKGVAWFDKVQDQAKQNLYVESPLGRRRHLWGLLVPKDATNADACRAAMLRRAVNSPVQGMGSDFMMIGSREIERLKWNHYKKTGHYPDFLLCNSVHDSLEVDCAYEDFWIAIDMIERGLTSCVAERVKQRHDFEFTIPLEIDFDVGANGRDVKSWDFDYNSMENILKDALSFQKNELGHDINAKKELKRIMEGQYQHMPLWMKKQLWSKGIEIPGMDKDPRTEHDLKIIERNRKESAKAKKHDAKKEKSKQVA